MVSEETAALPLPAILLASLLALVGEPTEEHRASVN